MLQQPISLLILILLILTVVLTICNSRQGFAIADFIETGSLSGDFLKDDAPYSPRSLLPPLDHSNFATDKNTIELNSQQEQAFENLQQS